MLTVVSSVEGRLPDVPEERSMPAAHARMQIPWETEKVFLLNLTAVILPWAGSLTVSYQNAQKIVVGLRLFEGKLVEEEHKCLS